jgi:hypothetical protein
LLQVDNLQDPPVIAFLTMFEYQMSWPSGRNWTRTLPQLLVTEAINDVKDHFRSQDPDSVQGEIEFQIRRLGRKPGFSMVAQLLRSSPDPPQITAALATVVTPRLFDVRADVALAQDEMTLSITFPVGPPHWFQSFIGHTMSSTEQFWFRAYASFIIGVYEGAILHFGYASNASFDHGPDGTSLAFTFALRKLGAAEPCPCAGK